MTFCFLPDCFAGYGPKSMISFVLTRYTADIREAIVETRGVESRWQTLAIFCRQFWVGRPRVRMQLQGVALSILMQNLVTCNLPVPHRWKGCEGWDGQIVLYSVGMILHTMFAGTHAHHLFCAGPFDISLEVTTAYITHQHRSYNLRQTRNSCQELMFTALCFLVY